MGDINDNYPEDEACYQAGMNWEANDNSDQMIDTTSGAEDAVLDLVELEQLHEESERMKGLGNKHMAAQVSIKPGLMVSAYNFLYSNSFCP